MFGQEAALIHLHNFPFHPDDPPLGAVGSHAHVDGLFRKIDFGERLDQFSIERILCHHFGPQGDAYKGAERFFGG